MHAVVGAVEIDASRGDEAVALLNETLVPMIRQMDGFVSGTWTRSVDGTQGRSIIVFESEAAAQAAATQARQGPPPGAPVSFVSTDVFEVVARA
jgi:hypothetical protein